MLKVYLTDLAAYNSSALVGKWINLPLEEVELHTAINEVLCEGELVVNGANHEEYFITDYEFDNLDLFEVDEYENIFTLNSNLKLLEELSQSQLKKIKFILDENYTYDIQDAILRADDVIIHESITLEDYAYDLMQELYNADTLPSIIANNIDYDDIAKDLDYEGVYQEWSGNLI